MIDLLDKNNIIIGILFSSFIITGNYLSELISCNIQELLHKSMLFKHFILFIMIYFTVELSDKHDINDPKKHIINTIIIYIFLILFSKGNSIINILAFTLIIFHYIANNFYVYYENKADEYNMNVWTNIKDTTFYILVSIMVLGFFSYLYKQITDKKQNFSLYKFIFGTTKCSRFI